MYFLTDDLTAPLTAFNFLSENIPKLEMINCHDFVLATDLHEVSSSILSSMKYFAMLLFKLKAKIFNV